LKSASSFGFWSLATSFTSSLQKFIIREAWKILLVHLMPCHFFFSRVSDFWCMQLWYKSNIILHLHAQTQENTIMPSQHNNLSCLIISFGMHCVGEHEGEMRFREQVFRNSCSQGPTKVLGNK
jgi:hypothetical protein